MSLGYKIIFICGNHEYYGKKFDEVNDYWKSFADKNEHFYFLNNSIEEINGIRFVGTTLWANIPDKLFNMAMRNLNDFYNIYYSNSKNPITPIDYNRMFSESVVFLQNNLKEGDVLITHHAPSAKSIHESFIDNALNCCYANNIDDLILDKKPKFLVHGHVHNSSDYYIGDTRVIANPRGYIGHNEGFNQDFNSSFIIKVR